MASMGLRAWYGYGDGELDPLGEESAVCDMMVRDARRKEDAAES